MLVVAEEVCSVLSLWLHTESCFLSKAFIRGLAV